jgi:hypothetical protein
MNGNEVIVNNEPDKRGEIRYFPLDQLPPQATVHSMVYLALEEFKDKIRQITGKTIVL